MHINNSTSHLTSGSPSLEPLLVQLHRPVNKILFICAAVLMWIYGWIYYPISQNHGGDFFAVLSGRQVNPGFWDGQGIVYGPVLALYDLAFRGVADLEAMRIMFILNLAMLIIAFMVAVRRFLPSPRTREETVAAAFLWIFFYPTFQALRQNNVEITELLFLVLMLEALRWRNDWLAGFFLGIAGATKILPFVLVGYFLWRRRFGVVAGSIFTGTALFYLVIILKGETLGMALASWWGHARGDWFSPEFQNNQAISGLVWRAFSHIDLSTRWNIENPLVSDPLVAQTITIGVSLVLFVVVSAIILSRIGLSPTSTSDQRLETVEIAIVLILMLLLLPHNHTHYFILCAWMYVAGLREWPRPAGAKAGWVFGLFGLSYVLLGLLHMWRFLDPILHQLGPVTGVDLARLASLPFFGALAGLVALLIVHGDLMRNVVQKT
jgi:hypothetical protein